jgi:hypothetical protein
MHTKISTVINIVLTLAVVALAINTYDTKEQLDSRLLESSDAVEKLTHQSTPLKRMKLNKPQKMPQRQH